MVYLVIVAVILIVALVIFLAAGGGGIRAMRRRQEARVDEAVTGRVESLTYHVPFGQDPAAIVHALQVEGFDVVREDAVTNPQELLILCPAGADRERARVRAVIAHEAALDMEGHPMPDHEVHFADEPHLG